MKNFSLTILLLIILKTISAQNIIIDDEIYGGTNIPFHDTLLPSWLSQWDFGYNADIDNDQIQDFNLYIYYYPGASGCCYNGVKITPGNGFEILLDTGYQEYYQDMEIDPYEAVDTVRTVTVPMKFNSGDTIDTTHISSNGSYYLSDKQIINEIGVVTSNIVPFDEDTAYVAFKKTINNKTKLYALKISIREPHTWYAPDVELFSVISNEPGLHIKTNPYNTTSLYPNPAGDYITIDTKGKTFSATIFNSLGQIVQLTQLNEKKIGISSLKKGVYFMHINFQNHATVKKFVKE
jgi:hypothetical protein